MLTGTPGTGKKAVGRELARMTGLEFVSLNDFAIRQKLGRRSGREFLVDVSRLKRRKIQTRGKIIAGHLLPEVVSPENLDFVAILRASPPVLRRRYSELRYGESKIRENLEAEILDLVSYRALQTYGRNKVGEFDTTRTSPETVARRVLETMVGKRPREYGKMRWAERAFASPRSLTRMANMRDYQGKAITRLRTPSPRTKIVKSDI